MGPSHSLADTHIPYHVTSRPPTDEVEVPACQRCVFLTRHQSAKSCPRSRVAFPLIVSLPLPAPQHGRSGRDRGKLMTTIAIHPFSLLSYVSVLTRHVRLGRPVLPTWCRPSAKAAPLSRRSRLVAPRTARRRRRDCSRRASTRRLRRSRGKRTVVSSASARGSRMATIWRSSRCSRSRSSCKVRSWKSCGMPSLRMTMKGRSSWTWWMRPTWEGTGR